MQAAAGVLGRRAAGIPSSDTLGLQEPAGPAKGAGLSVPRTIAAASRVIGSVEAASRVIGSVRQSSDWIGGSRDLYPEPVGSDRLE